MVPYLVRLLQSTDKKYFALQPDSLDCISALEVNFTGATQHRGNHAAINCANCVQKSQFPRNCYSLIEILEVKINGQLRQDIINTAIFLIFFIFYMWL
jgi:hypothetical protein